MSKSKTEMTKVYPVAGRFLLGVPHVAQEVSAEEAKALVASGAFTDTKPAAEAEEQEK